MPKTRYGAILAAGAGRRLASPRGKALHDISGRPLILRVLEQFRAAGITRVYVAVRQPDTDLPLHLKWWGIRYGFEFLKSIQVDEGTGPAVRSLTHAIGKNAHVLSMVDTIAPAGAVGDLIRFAEERSRYYVPRDRRPLCVLAATELAEDEAPAWIHAERRSGVVGNVGKSLPPSGLVFGNMRWVSADGVSALLSNRAFSSARRDTEIMRLLIRSEYRRVLALPLGDIYDIDRDSDAKAAAAWLEAKSAVRVIGDAQTDSPRRRRRAGMVRPAEIRL